MIETMAAAGIPISEKVAIESAEIENKDEVHEADISTANAESIESFNPSKRYTKAQKLQFAIDFCKKQNPQGYIFSETQDIPVSKEDIENFFIFDSDATDENIYFLYKKTNDGTLCGRTKYAYSYEPAVNSEFYQSLHASSKKLNGADNEHLASGAEATSIQERIIGTYIAAFIAGTLTENSKFYTLGEVLYPNEQCYDKNMNYGRPLFDFEKDKLNSKGIDVSWSKMFDKLFKALKVDAKDNSHQAEFNFELLKGKEYVCIHPGMRGISEGLKKLFASGVKGSQTAKDTVIPADLYLIKKDSEASIINAFNAAKSLDDLCALTNYFFGTVSLGTLMTSTGIEASPDLALVKNKNSSRESAELNLNNAIIIPISLKKNESAPNVYLIMNTPQNIPKVRVQDITEVVFNKSGNSYFKAIVDEGKTNSEFRKHFGGKPAYFEFRWKNSGANWQCTATVEDADAYLGGSVKEVASQVFKENKLAFFGENKVGFTEKDIELLYNDTHTLKEKIKIKYNKKEDPIAATYQDIIDLHESMLLEEESSSKAGRCGLFQVLISLLKQSDQDANLSEIVAKSFKMDPSIQDTVKIM